MPDAYKYILKALAEGRMKNLLVILFAKNVFLHVVQREIKKKDDRYPEMMW